MVQIIFVQSLSLSLHSVQSDFLPITKRVLHGSIQGPSLFLIFINDFPTSLNYKLRFKLCGKDLRNSRLYKSLQSKLLLSEISSKESACCARREDAIKDDKALHSGNFSWLDFRLVKSFISRTTRELPNKSSNRRRKKLRSFGLSSDLTPCDPNKVVHNYSSMCISKRIKPLLAFRLELFLPLEKLASRLKNDNHALNKSEFFTRLEMLVKNCYYWFRPYKVFSSVFRKDDITAVKQLSSNKSVVVCRPDKGRGVVTVDKNKYLDSMHSIISDCIKFEPVIENVIKYTFKLKIKINLLISAQRPYKHWNKQSNYNIYQPKLTYIEIITFCV